MEVGWLSETESTCSGEIPTPWIFFIYLSFLSLSKFYVAMFLPDLALSETFHMLSWMVGATAIMKDMAMNRNEDIKRQKKTCQMANAAYARNHHGNSMC